MMRPLLKSVLPVLFALLVAGQWMSAQIVNQLKVEDEVFQRYAYCRMQRYNPSNLGLADTLCRVGTARDNFRFRVLGLSLEYPVRFAQGNYEGMDRAVAEIKELLKDRSDTRSFYYSTVNEYCQYLIHIGRASDAMLEARDMERLAGAEKSALGRMYAHRIVGLIQSYRTNSFLAVENFTKSAEYCVEAKAEQEIPNLYILIAQEYIRLGDFPKAEEFCQKAEAYQEFFPSLRIKSNMTRAYLYNAEGDLQSFWRCYDTLVNDPLYTSIADDDERFGMDVAYLKSKGLFEQALAAADSLGVARDRYERKHGIYAAKGDFPSAYSELNMLMASKDSIYINVQNEDMAILDAEMNNAQLRQDAERLKAQNQITILLGFLIMFVIAFGSMLVSQARLRENLDVMKSKNNEMLMARRAYQNALDSKESEIAMRVKILQNRKSNPSITL